MKTIQNTKMNNLNKLKVIVDKFVQFTNLNKKLNKTVYKLRMIVVQHLKKTISSFLSLFNNLPYSEQLNNLPKLHFWRCL